MRLSNVFGLLFCFCIDIQHGAARFPPLLAEWKPNLLVPFPSNAILHTIPLPRLLSWFSWKAVILRKLICYRKREMSQTVVLGPCDPYCKMSPEVRWEHHLGLIYTSQFNARMRVWNRIRWISSLSNSSRTLSFKPMSCGINCTFQCLMIRVSKVITLYGNFCGRFSKIVILYTQLFYLIKNQSWFLEPTVNC